RVEFAAHEGPEEPSLLGPRRFGELLGQFLEAAPVERQLTHLLGLAPDAVDLGLAVKRLDTEEDGAHRHPLARPEAFAIGLVITLDLVGRHANAPADLPVHELGLLELAPDPLAIRLQTEPLLRECGLEAVAVDPVPFLHLLDVLV